MLDVVTFLEPYTLAEVRNLKHVRRGINLLPGGSGSTFALGAVQEGFDEVCLIGKIGADSESKADLAAQLVLNQLADFKIGTHVAFDAGKPTGTVMIMYLPDDERLLVAEIGANSSFCIADVTPAMERCVECSDVLFISGYGLLDKVRAQAIIYLMRKARDAGCLVVLDVVPHSIYKTMDTDAFLTLTEPVHVIAAEVNTMKRMFLSGVDRLPESNVPILKVADHIFDYYDAAILQPELAHQVVIDRRGIIEAWETGAGHLTSRQLRGFNDRVIARSLLRHYPRLAGGLSASRPA
jgi:hypothetical protein